MMNLKALNTKSITAPVSEQHPCGLNIRYDEEFEQLEEELSKQGSLIDRGKVNWDKVIELCVDILTHKSKDLKVSCYLNRALYENFGFKGLALGLRINNILLNDFWASLYPLKSRARANAFEWFSTKMESLLSTYKLPENNVSSEFLADIKLSYTLIKAIEELLIKHLENNAPALGNMRRSLKELQEQAVMQNQSQTVIEKNRPSKEPFATQDNLQSRQESTSEPQPESIPEPGSDNKQSTDTGMVARPDRKQAFSISALNINDISEKQRVRIFRECQEALRNIASYDTRKNLDSPSAYALNRMSTWININQVPVNNNGLTPLKPVPKDKRNRIAQWFNQQQYEELIPQAESSFARCPFWLDAHRYVCLSLESLGFEDSARQVREYLAVFLRRFPDIVLLKFSDQSEFADEQTRQWIAEHVLCEHSENSQFLSTAIDVHNEDFQETLELTNKLGQQKKLKEAIVIFHQKIARETHVKQKTLWKYHLAEFCFKQGEHPLSTSILKEINGFIWKNNLQYWEPELTRNVTYLLYQCLKKTADKYSAVYSDKQTSASKHKEGLATKTTDRNSVSVSSMQVNDNVYRAVQQELEQLYTCLCQLDPVLALELS